MEVRNDDFWINGVSARSIGITTVDPLVPPPMASRRYNTYQIGSDTDLVDADDSFDDITYPITMRVIGKPGSLDNSALYAFLAGARMLRLSRLKQYEFQVQKIAGITPSMRSKGNEMIYNVSFKLAPWKYVADEPEITLTAAGNVQNAGTRYCKPVYTLTITGAGTGTLTVNGQTVVVNIPVGAGGGTFTIDSEKQIAYDGNNQIHTHYTSGIFPWMNVGNNFVQFGGVVSGVTIKRNERCY